MDSIVIGAGAAGLVAAARLREAGDEVVLLEGRDRVGGRILTHRGPGIPVPVELGAEFLHGDARLTRELLDEAGVDVIDIDPEQWEARDGAVRPARMWRDVERVMARLDAGRDPDRSFAEFLRSDDARGLSPEAIESASAFVEGFHAAELDRVSERSLAEDPGLEGALQAARVPAGYDRLVHHLAAPLLPTIRLRHVVDRVRWSAGRVTVHGSCDGAGFTIDGHACVVTAPLALLASDASGPGPIRFDPPVDALAAAHGSIALGDVVRAALVLDRVPAALLRPAMADASAGLDREFFLHTPREPFNVYWPITPSTAPVLVAWAGGGRTRALPRGGGTGPDEGEAVARVARDGLERAAGIDLAGAVRALAFHDWRADPFSRGAYSYTLVGGSPPEPVDAASTLFFAGEAFAGETIGTVEGALETGLRAAEALLLSR